MKTISLKNEIVDITAPAYVEVKVREDGQVLWVNVDGVCALRICRPQNKITVIDHRRDV